VTLVRAVQAPLLPPELLPLLEPELLPELPPLLDPELPPELLPLLDPELPPELLDAEPSGAPIWSVSSATVRPPHPVATLDPIAPASAAAMPSARVARFVAACLMVAELKHRRRRGATDARVHRVARWVASPRRMFAGAGTRA